MLGTTGNDDSGSGSDCGDGDGGDDDGDGVFWAAAAAAPVGEGVLGETIVMVKGFVVMRVVNKVM